MKLILVRHGETHWNKDHRIQGGDSDIELNDTGLEQVRRLAAFLENQPIIAIRSSPMQRAIATAEAIASYHQVPVEVDQGLKELKVGDLEGMSLADLGITFSQFLIKWWKERGTMKLPNGESLADLQQRAWEAVEELLKRQKTSPENNTETAVVVVSHYFVTLVIILKALDLPLDYFNKFTVSPGGISILEFRDGRTRLAAFNDTSY